MKHLTLQPVISNDENILKVMGDFYKKTAYILDPHTACGISSAYHFREATDCPTVCFATAHPAKFGDTVYKACNVEPTMPEGIKKLFNKKKKTYNVKADIDDVKKFFLEKLQ